MKLTPLMSNRRTGGKLVLARTILTFPFLAHNEIVLPRKVGETVVAKRHCVPFSGVGRSPGRTKTPTVTGISFVAIIVSKSVFFAKIEAVRFYILTPPASQILMSGRPSAFDTPRNGCVLVWLSWIVNETRNLLSTGLRH